MGDLVEVMLRKVMAAMMTGDRTLGRPGLEDGQCRR